MGDIDYIANEVIERLTRLCCHTAPTFWDQCWVKGVGWGAAFVAAIASLVAFGQIWREIKKRRFTAECQRAILKDLVRHFWQNEKVVRGLRMKMEEVGYTFGYPSEIHFLKLKVLPEDLNLDRFAVTSRTITDLHRLSFHFRNYDMEAEVACIHFQNKDVSAAIRCKDLDLLEARIQKLAKEVVELSEKLKLGHLDTAEIIKNTYQHEYTNIEGCCFAGRSKTGIYDYYEDIGLGSLLDKAVTKFQKEIVILPFVPSGEE